MSVEHMAILAGLLQACGYFFYLTFCLKDETKPNPTSWLMFAYGTATLTLLEWDHEAKWTMLLLPVVCALLSLLVAWFCFKKGTLAWPKKWIDRSAFLTDVTLTIGYISIWFLQKYGPVSTEDKATLVLIFLVITNLSTMVSFVPLITGTLDDPRTEHPLPWFVWASAYATLGLVTFREEGTFWSVFMIYPVMNTFLHGSIGILALRRLFLRTAQPLAH